MSTEHTAATPTGDRPLEARLLESLAGLDLTSADGRAGIATLLSEIERACPGAILRQAAGMDLRRLGWGCGMGRRPQRTNIGSI